MIFGFYVRCLETRILVFRK